MSSLPSISSYKRAKQQDAARAAKDAKVDLMASAKMEEQADQGVVDCEPQTRLDDILDCPLHRTAGGSER